RPKPPSQKKNLRRFAPPPTPTGRPRPPGRPSPTTLRREMARGLFPPPEGVEGVTPQGGVPPLDGGLTGGRCPEATRLPIHRPPWWSFLRSLWRPPRLA